ncbi:hypothetical protein PoB_006036800 [Plakobranchus ocellatus]|uniref:Uncharacterized protein n=1 Tax=Plakobranchus ocellatus TaxID=259542 RepID=A0AAV4CPN9_9GAST|nr:hypothetical protein PoB_006036800 [Plakobranchus ocellatus]
MAVLLAITPADDSLRRTWGSRREISISAFAPANLNWATTTLRYNVVNWLSSFLSPPRPWSALRSARTLLSSVRVSPPAPWPDGGPESLR